MKTPPAIRVPEDLRKLLAGRGGDLLERVELFLDSAPRRCTYITSERAATRPLRRDGLGRLFSRPSALPVLGRLESKFGGIPYSEDPSLPWDGFSFLGQINFAEIADPLPEAPSQGILAVDMYTRPKTDPRFRVRWYPAPSEQAACGDARPSSVAKWETRMRFRAGWSLPGGKAWHVPLPAEDKELWYAWNDFLPEGYLDCERQLCHRILGYRSSGLDENYGFEPPEGGSDRIEEYEMLWRITFDNPAGFEWGTNWIYVIVHDDDLAAGRLERAVVTGANC